MNWSPNINNSVTPASSILYSNTQSHSSSKSIEFYFSAAGGSAPCANYLAELDFDLGASYREVTFLYWMYIPTNYAHYASGSSNNNKFMRLSPTNPPSAGTERYGFSTERNSDFVSDMSAEWDDTLGGGMTAHGTFATSIISSSDFGTWVKFAWYCKAATARTTGLGIIKMWKNDALVISETPDSYDAPNTHNFRYGYLLGAVNSFRSGDTRFYIDDMTVWGNP